METCAPLTIYKRGRVDDVHGKAVTWATQVFSVFPPVLGCDTKYISIIHLLFKQQQQQKKWLWDFDGNILLFTYWCRGTQVTYIDTLTVRTYTIQKERKSLPMESQGTIINVRNCP